MYKVNEKYVNEKFDYPMPILFKIGPLVSPFWYLLKHVSSANPSAMDSTKSHCLVGRDKAEDGEINLKNSATRWKGDEPSFSAICQLNVSISAVVFWLAIFLPGLTLRLTYLAFIPILKHLCKRQNWQRGRTVWLTLQFSAPVRQLYCSCKMTALRKKQAHRTQLRTGLQIETPIWVRTTRILFATLA